ncbi:MAG: hypothetical protein HY774_14025 [Acidobacteria bacterium]|nr:hypothetical protein [Acidobacteriota bacterium]
MKKMYVILIAVFVMAGAMAGMIRAKDPVQSELNVPTSLPEAEAKAPKRVSDRSDSGRLNEEEFRQQLAGESTLSSRYVMSDVSGESIKLPVTGTTAAIGVFSLDASAEFELKAPGGSTAVMQPISRDEMFATPDATKRMVTTAKMMATPVQAVTEVGSYTLNVHSKAPVDIVVNDNNDLMLKTWLSKNTVDVNEQTEIRAQILNGKATEAATISARLFGEDKKLINTVNLNPTAEGFYSATVSAENLGTFTNVIVDAAGTTAEGKAFLRTGNITLMTGKAGAKLGEVVSEQLTAQNLDVTVSIKVKGEGRFHLRANLVNAAGEPMAWAQAAERLTPGNHTLTLHFDRSAIPGGQELVVRDLELTDVTQMPGVKSPNKLDAYAVQAKF